MPIEEKKSHGFDDELQAGNNVFFLVSNHLRDGDSISVHIYGWQESIQNFDDL